MRKINQSPDFEQQKILLVFDSDPFHPETGGQNRVYNLFSRISETHSIATLEPHTNKDIKPTYDVDQRHYFKDYSMFSKRIGSFLASVNPSFIHSLYNAIIEYQPDIIHKVGVHGYIPLSILKYKYDVSLIYAGHNVERKHISEIENPPLEKFIRKYTTLIEERIACDISDVIVSVSERDKQAFNNLYSPNQVNVVPSGVDLEDISNNLPVDDAKEQIGINQDKIAIGFHGTYWYTPNQEAVEIIRENIAPAIADEDILFLLAGKDMEEFDDINVKSLGYIDDLNTYINALDIAIVPLTTGGGTKLKMLDYMAGGKPIITTKIGAEGLDIKPGRDAIVVEDIQDFQKSISYLSKNPNLRKRLGNNARNLAEQKYDWDELAKSLAEVQASM